MSEAYKSKYTGQQIDDLLDKVSALFSVNIDTANFGNLLPVLKQLKDLDSGVVSKKNGVFESSPITSDGIMYVDERKIKVGIPSHSLVLGSPVSKEITSCFKVTNSFRNSKGERKYHITNVKVGMTVTGRTVQFVISFYIPPKASAKYMKGDFKNIEIATTLGNAGSTLKKLGLPETALKPKRACTLTTIGCGKVVTGYIDNRGVKLSAVADTIKPNDKITLGGTYVF